MIFQQLIFFITSLTATAATSSVDAPKVYEKLKSVGLSVDAAQCKPTNFAEGQGQQLSFMEMAFDCGGLNVQMEISQPISPSLISQQVSGEVTKIHESYGATKNPYAGFVSQTTQCPPKENFWQEKFKTQPLLFGRMTERGAWGACGKASDDFWGALTFVEGKNALAKVRIIGKGRLAKAQFTAQAHDFLKSVRNHP